MLIYEVKTEARSFWFANKRMANKHRVELKRSNVKSYVIKHEISRNKKEVIALLNRISTMEKKWKISHI